MSEENIRTLLVITERSIEHYQDFMAEQGNWDEFENDLYSHHFNGAHEDYLVFGNKMLEILYRRKRKLERLLNGGDSNV